MSRSEVLQFRLTPEEMERLRSYAEARGWTMAQVLRDLIRQLPKEKAALKGGA